MNDIRRLGSASLASAMVILLFVPAAGASAASTALGAEPGGQRADAAGHGAVLASSQDLVGDLDAEPGVAVSPMDTPNALIPRATRLAATARNQHAGESSSPDPLAPPPRTPPSRGPPSPR